MSVCKQGATYFNVRRRDILRVGARSALPNQSSCKTIFLTFGTYNGLKWFAHFLHLRSNPLTRHTFVKL